jgi:hypothetical protein
VLTAEAGPWDEEASVLPVFHCPRTLNLNTWGGGACYFGFLLQIDKLKVDKAKYVNWYWHTGRTPASSCQGQWFNSSLYRKPKEEEGEW